MYNSNSIKNLISSDVSRLCPDEHDMSQAQIFNQSRQFCADPGTLCVIHTFVSNICQPSRDHRGGDISPHHAEAPPAL